MEKWLRGKSERAGRGEHERCGVHTSVVEVGSVRRCDVKESEREKEKCNIVSLERCMLKRRSLASRNPEETARRHAKIWAKALGKVNWQSSFCCVSYSSSKDNGWRKKKKHMRFF